MQNSEGSMQTLGCVAQLGDRGHGVCPVGSAASSLHSEFCMILHSEFA